MSKNDMLIVDWADSALELQLDESSKRSGRVKFKGKFQEAEAPNKNKRIYPYGVLDENVRRLKSIISNRGLIGELDHPCLTDSDFDVLTIEGWKRFEDIKVGDKVYSRLDGQMVESKVEDIVDEHYKGSTIKFKGRSIDCEFTSPHKILMCKRDDSINSGKQYYITAKELHQNRKRHSHSYIPKTANWEGENSDQIRFEAKRNYKQDLVMKTKDFAMFLGLWLAEGSLQTSPKTTNRINIHQKTSYGKNLVRQILDRTGLDWIEKEHGFEVADARLYDYLKPLGKVYNKRIPETFKQCSKEILENLIIGFAIGDGRIQKQKNKCINIKECNNLNNISINNGSFSRINIFSVSKRLIDDLHECIIKCGLAGNISTIITKKDYKFAGRTIKAENKRPLYQLHISRTKAIHADLRSLETIESEYEGNIYCLKTEYGNFYMRYKGKSFWTGNCDSIIHFEKASHLITNLWWENQVLMGEGEILNTPCGHVLKALIEDGVRVGISSRGVGNGKTNTDGVLVIGESYKLITFDAVADPSTFEAFQEKIINKESNTMEVLANNYYNSEDNGIKKEGKSINKLSKEAIIAAMGVIFKESARKIKSEI